MAEPEHGNTARHSRDIKVYQTYKIKDRVARILMLSSMRNDLMLRFEKHCSALVVWDNVNVQYGGTLTMRLQQLTLKFDAYNKQSNHTMR